MKTSWEESLDVDDSDLQSVFRPCKQQNRRDTTAAAVDCSQSQTLVFSQSPVQTVKSHPESIPPPPFRRIPGPAGIIQAAKLRKSREMENSSGQEEVHLMATQEFIRKVVEDPQEDEDFKRGPWISAIEFIHSDDSMLNGVYNASLGDIKKYEKNGKLEQVVAVIKSCAPNVLGDLIVTLKDPTGTVSGTIHHKVIAEGQFSKGICVGSVLILRKVSVFSPSRSAHYLNITKRNLVKVFYKDGGSSQTQIFVGCKSTDASPGSDPAQATQMLHNAYSQERRARTMNGIKITPNNKPSLVDDREKENINSIASIGNRFSKTSNNVMTQKIAPENEILIEVDVIRSGENEHIEPATVHVHVKQATEQTSASASLPSWTDEQLHELLDCDLEDF